MMIYHLRVRILGVKSYWHEIIHISTNVIVPLRTIPGVNGVHNGGSERQGKT